MNEDFFALLDHLEEFGPWSTDDLLAAFLPLARAVLELHDQDLVAPLAGLEAITVAERRLGLAPGLGQTRRSSPRVCALDASAGASSALGIEVVAEHQVDYDLDRAQIATRSLEILDDRAEIDPERPSYLRGYASWEHRLGHHDQLTDIFALGQILASLALSLDFTEAAELELFLGARANLFAIAPDLHPVVAAVIREMTELARPRRAQDLLFLISRLESYRDQPVAIDLESLAFRKDVGRDQRRRVILTHLRDRLFDLSRRNPLLYFRPTLATLNLTVESVPILLDYRNIRAEQLFFWHSALAAEVIRGAPIALGRWLRFEDLPYLPGQLDKIIAEARRDRTERGFAQLRLVLVFLRWHDLKGERAERIHSPLLLLPVELIKKKGIRDQYFLTPTTSEVEVNPALRFHLKQRYDLDLPEMVDLRATSLESFHADLAARLRASEKNVELHLVDKCRIELIHERARLRLEAWKRRSRHRLGARLPTALDYSYDPKDFRPRGLRLFRECIQIKRAALPELLAHARPQRLTPEELPAPDPNQREAGRPGYSVTRNEDHVAGNPFAWEFDLTALTLGNFNYRKMSLLRDYAQLLEQSLESAAFEKIFSLEAKEAEPEPAILPLADQYLVLAADATQVRAAALAQSGRSFIIQGPPGTGKSQTITNLIADFSARRKSVLFVCEKRVALDIVFHRLRQQGLEQLCVLIHDFQTDKKAFVNDLKLSCESWLSGAHHEADTSAEAQRHARIEALDAELKALADLAQLMGRERPEIGASSGLRDLLHRLVELGRKLELPAEIAEMLPDYAVWRRHHQVFEDLAEILARQGADPCFSRHPLRTLTDEVLRSPTPLATFNRLAARARAAFARFEAALAATDLDLRDWPSFSALADLRAWVVTLAPLATRGLLGLLERSSTTSRELEAKALELEQRVHALIEARTKTSNWREPLPADDVAPALELAERFESKFWAFLVPSFRRLRRVLEHAYGFDQHKIPPRLTRILRELLADVEATRALETVQNQANLRFGTKDPSQLAAKLRPLIEAGAATPRGRLRQALLSSADGVQLVSTWEQALAAAADLESALDALVSDGSSWELATIGARLKALEDTAWALPELLPALLDIAELPAELRTALREAPLAVAAFENAIAHKTLETLTRADGGALRFDTRQLERRLETIAGWQAELHSCNGAVILQRVRREFLEHVAISLTSATQLEAEEKQLKKVYAKGRRELEHEFGKTMRFRSIRDLAGDETGVVVRDLKPIWLMSPLSISDTLPLEADLFDVLIFDEASQIPVEDAVPALFRARQVIVVGDEMQLPPTTFFSAGTANEVDPQVEIEGERVVIELDSDSLLTQSARHLPSTLLAWHYRSRYEALIQFSNAAFYGDELVTVPDRRLAAADLPELRVESRDQASPFADELLARSLSFHFCAGAVYDERRNVKEAAYIAELVRVLLSRGTGKSIGIVAFSEAQQVEIENALDDLAAADALFAKHYELEQQREQDDQFCGLFVKNLENVQGDERDIILISICYGPDPSGKMKMNFGPINLRGGEKRLNVIFSRAKEHMAVVSSIRHHEIKNDYNIGAAALKRFLRFAERVSVGDLAGARASLEGLDSRRRRRSPNPRPALENDAVVLQLAARLRERGWSVDLGAGQSTFRCDLAVRPQGAAWHQLAIQVDRDPAAAAKDPTETFLRRPGILRAFGWQTAHVLTRDWWHEPEVVLARLESLLRGAADSGAAGDQIIEAAEKS